MYGEDPSVQELQAEAARLTGKEAALLVPSGTMGNLSAVLAHCSERGSEVCRACRSAERMCQMQVPEPGCTQVILGDESHIYVYEAGGLSVLGGVPFHVVPNTPTGELPLNLVRAAIRHVLRCWPHVLLWSVQSRADWALLQARRPACRSHALRVHRGHPQPVWGQRAVPGLSGRPQRAVPVQRPRPSYGRSALFTGQLKGAFALRSLH